jgi:hypothetical protein
VYVNGRADSLKQGLKNALDKITIDDYERYVEVASPALQAPRCKLRAKRPRRRGGSVDVDWHDHDRGKECKCLHSSQPFVLYYGNGVKHARVPLEGNES